MKRISVVILLCIALMSTAAAYNYQKLISYQIGPGTHYSYYEEKSVPWALYVVEIDITNPYITLESVKAQDYLYAFEWPSDMSKRKDTEGHRSVSAINGDYYNTSNGEPISTHVVNGEFVKTVNNPRTAFVFNKEKKLNITTSQFSGAVLAIDSLDQWTSYPISTVNAERGENALVLYNRFIGNSTGTNEYGFECLAVPVDDWLINDTVRCVIEARESNGNMSFPENKFVISGHGNAVPFLDANCGVGDTVKVVQNLLNNLPRITQVVSGGPRMLENGVDVVDSSYPEESIGRTHCTYRHPRTAIGFNMDSTKVFFVVVDGRQEGFSIGMSLSQLAAFMKEVGAAHAVNLDGGGSSAMVVRNALKNSPSDGSERRVANSILCVSSAPKGDLEHIQFIQDSVAVYKNKTISTGITGWDMHYNPKGIGNWDDIDISFNTSLGVFSEGDFTAAEEDGTTILTAEFNAESDSVIIHIIALDELEISPKYVTTDSSTTIKFSVSAVNEANNRVELKNDIYQFEVLNPTVGTVNEAGEFNATQSGETGILVSYGDNTDTAFVSVEIGEGETVLDEVESLEDYTLTADDNINMDGTELVLSDRIAGSGSKAIQVNYTHAGGRDDGNIYLEHDPLTIYGLPSHILIDALGDSIGHWVYILLEDNEGKEYYAKTSESLLYNDDYRTLYCPMDYLLPYDRNEVYPLTYKGLRLRVNDKADSGTVYLDRIRVIYPTWTSIEKDDDPVLPEEFFLEQNYPNPFNPETRISYRIDKAEKVTLDIFDIRGKYVQTLVNEYQTPGAYTVSFQAEHLPAGIYYYRLTAGAGMETKKMVLIK